jgi:hypothetical protein
MRQNRWNKTFIRVFKLSVHFKSQKINEISSHYMLSIIVGFSNGFQAILSVKDELHYEKQNNCSGTRTHDIVIIIKEKQTVLPLSNLAIIELARYQNKISN